LKITAGSPLLSFTEARANTLNPSRWCILTDYPPPAEQSAVTIEPSPNEYSIASKSNYLAELLGNDGLPYISLRH
jgi:hypothetical protein